MRVVLSYNPKRDAKNRGGGTDTLHGHDKCGRVCFSYYFVGNLNAGLT